ncbi:MAG: DeoR/GlpR transcriptional regulator [Lachnospiraceae bacterium]|jgi:DeoR family transcriptional regulator of aga operon|nr:DeoR/GlpR transcriptional regulator [Lachnospiraceae bacterium]
MESRRDQILNLINREGEVSFTELKKNFPYISDVTLRKDLRYLDSAMKIIRVHGGAKSLPVAIGTVDNFYTRSQKYVEEKKSIAALASKLIQPNNSLFIASGSTCHELSKVIPDIPLQIFTDGLTTALELSKLSNVETTILGGQIHTNENRSSGPAFFAELSRLQFDFAFLGTDGYQPNFGFVCCSTHSAALFQTLISHSDKVVVLMDHSKVSARRAARNIPANQIDIVISDSLLDSNIKKKLIQVGVNVIQPDANASSGE